MRYLLLFSMLSVLFMGCLKKNDTIDELNTNIFDHEYQGEQWFVIDEAVKYTNDLGQIRVRFEMIVPAENTPELKGSYLPVAVKDVDGQWKHTIWSRATGGIFFGAKEFAVNPSDNYCVEVGILNVSDSSVINVFTACETVE